MKLEEIEQDLIRLCDAAVAKGWTLKQNSTYCPANNKCCALGAAYVVHPDVYDVFNISYARVAKARYGLNRAEAVTLTDGFDGQSFREDYYLNRDHWYGLHQIGVRLRQRYVK